MHNCEKCQKKVKNGFKMCYACHDSKSDSEILPKKHVRKPTKSYVTGETMT